MIGDLFSLRYDLVLKIRVFTINVFTYALSKSHRTFIFSTLVEN